MCYAFAIYVFHQLICINIMVFKQDWASCFHHSLLIIDYVLFFLDLTGCIDTPNGAGYVGAAATTLSGYPCAKWRDIRIFSAYGFIEYDAVSFPDEHVDHNYCRNPLAGKERPWCHSTHPDQDWEFCPLPKCGRYLFGKYFKSNF